MGECHGVLGDGEAIFGHVGSFNIQISTYKLQLCFAEVVLSTEGRLAWLRAGG